MIVMKCNEQLYNFGDFFIDSYIRDRGCASGVWGERKGERESETVTPHDHKIMT